MRKTVAAVIPVKNVEKIIRGALESLKFCDEVILVDMFSTDKTKEIALSYPNVRFFERNGYIFSNINYGRDQAKSEYIIRLDSDERLSVELQKEIVKELESPSPSLIYTAPYYSFFLGKAMMYGGKFQVRDLLFKKGVLRYSERSEHESFSRTAGHENVEVGTLRESNLPYSLLSIKKYIEKVNYYSEKDLERASGNDLRPLSGWKICYHAVRFFLRQYVRQEGHKDGQHGLAMALLDTFYIVIHHLKVWEKAQGLKAFHDREREECDRVLKEQSLNK